MLISSSAIEPKPSERLLLPKLAIIIKFHQLFQITQFRILFLASCPRWAETIRSFGGNLLFPQFFFGVMEEHVFFGLREWLEFLIGSSKSQSWKLHTAPTGSGKLHDAEVGEPLWNNVSHSVVVKNVSRQSGSA